LLDAFRGRQLKATIILFVSPLLLVTWKYFGTPDFYHQRFSSRLLLWDDPAATAAIYSFVASFVLLGLVPALVVKLVFREKLSDYGVQLGKGKRVLRSVLLWAPLFLLSAYSASGDSAIVEEYPINKSAGASASMFGIHACAYVVFYLGVEFHFRGFLQFGLRESMGTANAVLVQAGATVLYHIGKPSMEAYGSVLGALLWGILAFRTQSLLPGLILHSLLGISLDWFICYG
jgi:membrane protease YdiL (CAAX protease family)